VKKAGPAGEGSPPTIQRSSHFRSQKRGGKLPKAVGLSKEIRRNHVKLKNLNAEWVFLALGGDGKLRMVNGEWLL
jgi:hypothetical protein